MLLQKDLSDIALKMNEVFFDRMSFKMKLNMEETVGSWLSNKEEEAVNRICRSDSMRINGRPLDFARSTLYPLDE